MKKIAIVTGASSGIGKLLATGLPAHAQFDELWAIARSEARLNALQEEMPIPVRPIPLDLTKAESIERVKSLLAEEKPVVSVLINASGYGVFERFDRIPEQDAAGMTDLNCRAFAVHAVLVAPETDHAERLFHQSRSPYFASKSSLERSTVRAFALPSKGEI